MRRACAATLVLLLAGWEPFRTADPDVEAGNRAYAEGRFDEAIAAYDRASKRGGVDAEGLAYDRGTATLRQAEAQKDADARQRLTERALEDLKQAARSSDPRIRGGANYNRGNALMGQDKLADAIEAYKQALREQPDFDDARLNLELALRRRQKQQQKQQQGQQGQQGQRGQQGQQGQQGQNGQGSNQNGSSGPGSDQNGSNGPGSDQSGSAQPQNGSNGPGSDAQRGSNGPGSSQPQSGSNGAGSNQSGSSQPQDGSNGQGSSQGGSNQPQRGSNGPGSNAQQNGSNAPSGNQDPSRGNPSGGPRGRAQRGRTTGQSPRTPTEGKLDDLDTVSRDLQKKQAAHRATGHASDPQHDW